MLSQLSQLAVSGSREKDGLNQTPLVIRVVEEVVWGDDLHAAEGGLFGHQAQGSRVAQAGYLVSECLQIH